MTELNFPNPPWSDGQTSGNYRYNATIGMWESKPLTGPKSTYGVQPPLNPQLGDEWINSNDMTAFGWYVDTDGGQWVEKTASISANGYYSPNYIINGAFEINQRGFTSGSANGQYVADRFPVYFATGTTTATLNTFTPGTSVANLVEKYMTFTSSGQTGATAELDLLQRVEDVRTLAGKVVTVSFWAKAATGTPKIAFTAYQAFGSGGSAGTVIPFGQVTLSTVWTRYSITGTITSIAGKTVGSGSYTQMTFWMSAGTNYNTDTGSLGVQNNTFDIAGIQIEEGSVATPFRRNANSIQGELAACQRYYWRTSASSGSSFCRYAIGDCQGTTGGVLLFQPPVQMRAIPAAIEYLAPVGNYSLWSASTRYICTSLAIATQTTSSSFLVDAGVDPGMTAGRSMQLLAYSVANTYIAFSAEL